MADLRILVIAAGEAARGDTVGRLFRAGCQVIGCPPDPDGDAPRLIRQAHYHAVLLAGDVPAEAQVWIRADVAQFLPRTPVVTFADGQELRLRLEALDP